MDPDFDRALYAVRKMPDVLLRLLTDPSLARIRTPENTERNPEPPAAKTPSNAKLAAKAAGSVLKWGMDGLKPAAPWVIERRLAACAACEFEAPAPDKLVYRGAEVAVGKGAKICTSCDCLIKTKAAMSTEHCPEKSPDNPDLSRWGEPWQEQATGWPWR